MSAVFSDLSRFGQRSKYGGEAMFAEKRRQNDGARSHQSRDARFRVQISCTSIHAESRWTTSPGTSRQIQFITVDDVICVTLFAKKQLAFEREFLFDGIAADQRVEMCLVQA